MYHNLYSYFAIDKHLNSFQLLVITKKATKDILVPISTYSCVLFTLQITLHLLTSGMSSGLGVIGLWDFGPLSPRLSILGKVSLPFPP